MVDEARHFPYTLREEPPILTAIDDRDEVGTSPLDDDLAFPDLEGSQLVRGPFREGVVDEILDDLEHPDEDVFVFIGNKAGGSVS